MADPMYHLFRDTQYLGQKSENELTFGATKGISGDIAIFGDNHTVSFELNTRSCWMRRWSSTLPKEIQAWLLLLH